MFHVDYIFNVFFFNILKKEGLIKHDITLTLNTNLLSIEFRTINLLEINIKYYRS